MKFYHFILIPFLLSAFLFAGCEGPEGPQGEPGPPGSTGEGCTYLGDNEQACGGMCHSSIAETWLSTGHSEAYHSLELSGKETHLYCVQCHVTGFDAEVSYGDSLVSVPGPDSFGFDDYWPPETKEDSIRIEALKNVQCEACHGPQGPDIFRMDPIMTFSTRMVDGRETSMCAKCHGEVEEWRLSGHGMVLANHNMTIDEFNRAFNRFSTCWECHTGEGFASVNDPYWAARSRPRTASLVGCPACHDPMDAVNPHQLRSLDSYSVLYDAQQSASFTGYGSAQLCVQCHHALRNVDNVQTQIEYGAKNFGPHSSPEMDMFLGSGCYEIAGYFYERGNPHNLVAESCVSCHMEMRAHNNTLGWKGGHDFKPTAATCLGGGCHSAMPEDFNLNNAASEIDSLLDRLIWLIGVEPEDIGDGNITTIEQRMAGYAYLFVLNDGSRGIHNPDYARSLLENAILFIESVYTIKGGKQIISNHN